jgi:ATP-dependent DNA ligase
LRGIRHRTHTESIFLSNLGLIEPHGDDLRHDPLAGRTATLEMILANAGPGIRFNEHIEGDGATVFRHACKLSLEGIVSKRKDSPYRSGRSPDWLKMKSSDARSLLDGLVGGKREFEHRSLVRPYRPVRAVNAAAADHDGESLGFR